MKRLMKHKPLQYGIVFAFFMILLTALAFPKIMGLMFGEAVYIELRTPYPGQISQGYFMTEYSIAYIPYDKMDEALYEITNVDQATRDIFDTMRNQTVYVKLELVSGKAEVIEASLTKPNDGLYIKGYFNQVWYDYDQLDPPPQGIVLDYGLPETLRLNDFDDQVINQLKAGQKVMIEIRIFRGNAVFVG